MISPRELALAISRPLCSGIAAAVLTFGFKHYFGSQLGLLLGLMLGGAIMLAIYLGTLLFILGQRTFYLDLFRGLKMPSGGEGFRRTEPLR